MKTNLKLSKITISKLDNLNFTTLGHEELINLKGGGDPGDTFTAPTVNPGGPYTVTRPGNDTTHLSSCQVDIEGNYSYTECIGRDS